MTAATDRVNIIVSRLEAVCSDYIAYVKGWKERTGRKAVGVLPMNFPVELVQAAGALPVFVQESDEPVTDGRNLIYEYYCAYSKSITDQAAKQWLDLFDGIFAVDHCVALLGALDAMRFAMPSRLVYLAQFPASMDEQASVDEVDKRMRELRRELEKLTGAAILPEAISEAIRSRNEARQIVRRLFALRRDGAINLSARMMQAVVQSGMIMDAAEYLETMLELEAALADFPPVHDRKVKLHLSGHFCHAPRPELFDMIEQCGAMIVDDDLYTGYRFVSTDVAETGDPAIALRDWYFQRNVNVPCSTRAQKTADWEGYLLQALERSGADGVIILMAKFCEPHMLYYPELRKTFRAQGVPYLLIETEHEGLALEMLRTRLESLVELISKRRAAEASGQSGIKETSV
ncbi:MAG: 2-hydroxyacyl-CoA dehydratase [Novosphingobium sp.]|nr:2-hydroxyacyl-CoA dehydratase [Novosphingobium sp.]MCP5389868.1 2-hydroxyacyl-CoA dehydratase [Novosphingobium sp.]